MLKKINFDFSIFFLANCIAGIGLLVLASAKIADGLIYKQAIRICAANIVMIFVANLRPRSIKSCGFLLYFSMLALLIALLILGIKTNGAKRWINIFSIRMQPSEFIKISLPIILASILTNHYIPIKTKNLLSPIAITLAPTLLIAAQPDLGTAILIAYIGIVMLFLVGLNIKFILYGIISIPASLPLIWFWLKPYQQKRIMTLLNPEQDLLGAGYHAAQAKIAIGSGGLYGKGWMQGSQTQLKFLPEGTTDFVFAVFGEEFGFIGAIILITLYSILILRIIYMATQMSSIQHKLITTLVACNLFSHVFVNIGMVTGILPVVGVPLPLISYGGSSLITTYISLGIAMSFYYKINIYADD